MIANNKKELKLKVISCIDDATEPHSIDYWREDLGQRISFGKNHSQEDVNAVIDSLVSDGSLANESYCVVTKSGEEELMKSNDLLFAETESELAINEADAFNECNWSPELGAETPIFRYVSVENFYRMLDDEENALAHFSKWDDPFEGFLFKGMAVLAGCKEFVDLHNLYSDYYGQCWTLDDSESEMRWRACACGTRGQLVRIESTVGRLFESLKQIVPKDWLTVCCKVGKVEYVAEQSIIELMKQIDLITEAKNPPSTLLFIKRKEFESEKEFRIVLDATPFKCHSTITGVSFKNGMVKYDVKFDSLVKSVLADPCMPRGDFDQLACRMCQKVPQIRVEQSTLFQWPFFVMQV